MQRPAEGPSGTKQDLRSFKLILEYIKALPVRPFYFLFFNIFFLCYCWQEKKLLLLVCISRVAESFSFLQIILKFKTVLT